MSKVANATLSPVMKQILGWSKDLNPWKRDALRRLIVAGEVTEADMDDLALACLSEHGALDADATVPKIRPLAANHLPTTAIAGQDVRIESLLDVNHTNALAVSQSMDFCVGGLTVIYGDNGSGKSGYARILKHACRARRKDSCIKSNVYEAAAGKRAAATLNCQIGTSRKSIEWQDPESPDELSSVCCFDSDCANVHVNDQNSVDFTPFGLDLFPKLVELCKRVKSKIEQRIEAVEKQRPPQIAYPGYRPTTKVGRAMGRPRVTITPDQLAELSHFTDKDAAEIKNLVRALNSDPERQANETKHRCARLKSLLNDLQTAHDAMGSVGLHKLRAAATDAHSKREAARLAAEQLLGKTPLPQIGGNPWKELWSAARRYSDLVYPDQTFPVVTDDARCVLCQQQFDEESRQRLVDFDHFVSQETEAAAAKAEKHFKDQQNTIANIRLDGQHTRALVDELKTSDPDLAAQIEKEIDAAIELQRAIAADSTQLSRLQACQCRSITAISALIELLNDKECQLREAIDETKREALKARLAELEDKRWLNENLEACVEEIIRRQQLRKMRKAAKSTSHSGISRKGGDLATTFVTRKLREAFAKEVKELCGRDINVALVKGRSHSGVATYQITLKSKQDAKPHEVLSEGEFRCIALAGFLTELATSDNKSAIVFDDPVCFLGPVWQSRVARRLAQEAQQRQVIVFSHDIFFVNELMRFSKDQMAAIEVSHVKRSATQIGLCRPGLPWLGAHTLGRIKVMRDRLDSIRAEYDAMTDEAKHKKSEDFYAQLRQTVERAAEREFIGGCVQRFSNYIPIHRLWEASVFNDDDADELHQIFRRCSPEIDSHDRAFTAQSAPPKIDDMLTDLDRLRDLIYAVHDKRDKLKERRRTRGRSTKSEFKTDF